ncbi:PDZ domain-containing protein [Devosia sp. 2618]|uniref:PDZ domain-containing protein n=1 Tax=Devosia sp. 2618 TaxID=3156454 RepID=UPI00339244AF
MAAATHLAATPLMYSTPSYALTGDVALPSPYVSRAFDAVLLPIDSNVIAAFDLDASSTGVLVLATEPGGVADSQGVEPGDVISSVRGHKISDPIELDEVVYYWIVKGSTDFNFDFYRAGTLQSAYAVITLALYETVIDIASVASWQSWSVSTSFSYAEFYEEYSVELTESYESSETIIEETITSEEFSEEVSEESTEDEITDDQTDEDEADDASDDADDDSSDDSDDGDDDSGDEGDDGAEDEEE